MRIEGKISLGGEGEDLKVGLLVGKAVNTTIEGCRGTIVAGKITTEGIGGGLVGVYQVNEEDISFSQCSIESNTSRGENDADIVGNATIAGGLIGKLVASKNFTLGECYSKIVTFAANQEDNEGTAGGLIGKIEASAKVTIENSFNVGRVRGADSGGLIGTYEKEGSGTLEVKHCYAAAKVESHRGSGGSNALLGKIKGDGTPSWTSVYYDPEECGTGTRIVNDGVAPSGVNEIEENNNYLSWDGTWNLTTTPYPTLKWAN